MKVPETMFSRGSARASDFCVGIDLGTTYSAIAWVDGTGHAKAIPDADGRTFMPSVVHFGARKNETTVGWLAKDMVAVEPDRTVQFVKREIGIPENSVRIDVDGVPHPYEFWGKVHSPEDISALILSQLKQQAEAHVGGRIAGAVVTVPAYFREPERAATIRAAEMAGLRVLRLINEPTAAGIAYGLRAGVGHQSALVFDLGGGTFDVTLLEVQPSDIRVIATAGDHRLGGKDWDDELIGFLARRFGEETGLDLADDPDAIGDIRDRVERLKCRLSEVVADRITVSAHGKRLVQEVTRERFEQLTAHLVSRCMGLVSGLMQENSRTMDTIDSVVLVGGSTRLPMIRAAIGSMWGRGQVGRTVNPDECVALGAAMATESRELMAAVPSSERIRVQERHESLPALNISDVTGHSLGFVTLADGALKNTIVIPKNTAIPCSRSRHDLTTARVGQESLEVHVVEGDHADPHLCSQTDSFACTGIPSGLEEPRLEVTFGYDSSGVIELRARELTSGKALKVKRILPADFDQLLIGTPNPMDIVLTLDTSGSMAGKDLVDMKDAAQRFLEEVNLGLNRVGVVCFDSHAQQVREISADPHYLAAGVHSLAATGSTAMHAGLSLAAQILETRDLEASPCIVLMSDGAPDSEDAALTAANSIKSRGCLIVTVATGGSNRAFMERLASSPSHAYDVSGQVTIGQTFSNLAREIAEGGILRMRRNRSD